jgi:hypothetical protein
VPTEYVPFPNDVTAPVVVAFDRVVDVLLTDDELGLEHAPATTANPITMMPAVQPRLTAM